MPDYTFGIKLAPDPQPYESSAELEAKAAQSNLAKIQVRAAVQKQRQSQLLSQALKKHAVVDPATGQPTVDNRAVLTDLYNADPEVGMAYEDSLAARAAENAQRQATAQKVQREGRDYARRRVAEEVAAIDTKAPDAAQRYAAAVGRLKSEGIPIPPEDEQYNPTVIDELKRRLIGPETLFKEENDLTQNRDTQTALTERTKYTADRGVDRARITGDASIERARVTADGTIAKERIVQDGKNNVLDTGIIAPDPFQGRFRMTSGQGPRAKPTAGASTNHNGIDYAAPVGTPVPAKTGGVVVEAGPNGGLGNWVRIKFDDGSEQGYGHLSTVSVKKGQRIEPGQVVALTGNTGVSTGPHVHVRNFGSTESGTSPDVVAKSVMSTTSPSRLSKQGAIALRANQDVKTAQLLNIDKQINAIGNALQVLKAGGETGPGTGTQNMIDRGVSAFNKLSPIPLSGDTKKREARLNAYDLVNALSTTEAIAALAGIGGNDTDKDFDRARATTVDNLRTKNYNLATLETAQALYKLQKEKAAFTIRWANKAGDPNGTINGVSLPEAWDAYAKKRMTEISTLAKRNGLFGTKSAPPKASTAKPGVTVVRRNVHPKGRPNELYNQMSDGSMVRVK